MAEGDDVLGAAPVVRQGDAARAAAAAAVAAVQGARAVVQRVQRHPGRRRVQPQGEGAAVGRAGGPGEQVGPTAPPQRGQRAGAAIEDRGDSLVLELESATQGYLHVFPWEPFLPLPYLTFLMNRAK